MGKKYLGAVTALGVDMPQFINFSQEGDKVFLTARSSVPEGSREIATSIPAVLFELMLADLNKNYTGSAPVTGAPQQPAPLSAAEQGATDALKPTTVSGKPYRPPYIKKKK